ncbi:MAG: GNAT family N-acetyltransferase [Erysipelotrichaceae bacterium]|nr:GNAT family N-acetyltransferase [Erysipelotrichaceae bacterium]
MQPLLLTDYEKIKPYLDMADYEGYNSNFVTMMMWNHEYHIDYEIHDHFCVMLHHFEGTRYWAMPFTSPEYYEEAIRFMIDYSKREKISFMIDCAVPSFVNVLKKIMPGEFIYERTRDLDDYVYDKNMLMTLSGKKMQKRRNHYNAFLKSYPDYEYRELSIDDDFFTILGCLTKWETDREATKSITSEVHGILYLLSSNHLLDIKLGGIFIKNELKAFIIASPLKHNTIQIHVEKADKTIRGLYPAILKEFLEHEYPNYEYVNREEDMGLENLRISKKRLHPAFMIEKYRIFRNWSSMGKATATDYDDIRRLWLDRFEDEDERSTDFCFRHRYRTDNTYVTKYRGHVICAIQIEPFKVKNHEDSYFIFGVSTDRRYEGQGVMGRLLKKVLDDYAGKRIYLQAYVPDIYRGFGFDTSHQQQVIKLNKRAYEGTTSLMLSSDRRHIDELYNEYVSRFTDYFVRSRDYYSFILRRTCAFGDNICTFKQKDQNVGYMIYHEDNQEIDIYEFIYKEDYLNEILILLAKSYTKRIIIHCDLKAQIEGKVTLHTNMMCNQRDENDITSRYINEVY